MINMQVGVDLAEVPVNVMPLVTTAGTTIDAGVTYDEAGIDLNWNFVDSAGALTHTNVVPTTAGVHDWTNQGNGMYTIEIPATGGTINNNAIGYGWFSGDATAVLPWRGPIINFGVELALTTTISAYTSDTSFTLAAGSTDLDAYQGWLCLVRDATTAAQRGLGVISTYSTGRVCTIDADTFGFTLAVGDYVTLIPQPYDLTTRFTAQINAEADTAISDAALATAAALTTAQNDLDIITGATGVNLLTATQASIDAIEADTNELQTDDVPGLIAALDVVVDRVEVDTQDLQTQIGTAGAGLTALPDQTMNITGNLSGSVGSVTGAVGSVTGAVGSVTGAVGSVSAGGITAASIATDAIDADALAADAINEISAAILPPTNTALNNIMFVMRDTSGDPVTGETVTGQRSIDGAAQAGVGGTIAEVGNGIYQFDAAQADMNGGIIMFRFSSAGTVDTFVEIITDAAF